MLSSSLALTLGDAAEGAVVAAQFGAAGGNRPEQPRRDDASLAPASSGGIGTSSLI